MSSYLYRPEEFVMGSLGGAIGANLPVGGPTINSILTAADPMQALIDLMQFGTKPDYMWGGNEASGATEIGGSGADLTDTGVTKQGSSAVAGAGSFTKFDGSPSGEAVYDASAVAGLQFGSASFAVLSVFGLVSVSSKYYICSDYEVAPASLGWRVYFVGEYAKFEVNTTSGAKQIQLAGHGAGAPQSLLSVRNMTTNLGYLYTGQGSASAAQFAGESVTRTAPAFAAAGGYSIAAEFDWGITAVWKGATAESLTQTHNDNLIAALGFGDGS